MSAGVVRVQSGPPTFDEGRLYRAFNGLPVQPEGFNKGGDPVDAKGKIMPRRQSVRFYLQDGRVFDRAGDLVEKPPKWVEALVAKMIAEEPFPGITHEARIIQCPVPGCGFHTPVERFFIEHKRQHQDVTSEQWAQLEGKSGAKRVPFSLSDFADPSKVAVPQLGQAPPVREASQGEG